MLANWGECQPWPPCHCGFRTDVRRRPREECSPTVGHSSQGGNVTEIIPATFAGVSPTGMHGSLGHNVAAESAVTFTEDTAAKCASYCDPRRWLNARRGLRQRAKTARMAPSRRGIGYPTGNHEKAAWRGSGKAWRGLRRRPEADTKLTACTTKKAARQPGARGSTGGGGARGRGNAHRGGFWRGGFCENMYTRCTRRFSRYANEATTA